jgi:[ribosomal protein S18]-alanine N-acetyltransferase
MPLADDSSKPRAAATVRPFRLEDADAVVAIAEQSPQAADWSRKSYVDLAEQASALFLVAEGSGERRAEVVGFLAARRVADQAEILNLAVALGARRRGYASDLVLAALADFRSRSVQAVFLEVRESNSGAVAFYAKHGFEKSGLRRGYYHAPDESAVVMTRSLDAEAAH